MWEVALTELAAQAYRNGSPEHLIDTLAAAEPYLDPTMKVTPEPRETVLAALVDSEESEQILIEACERGRSILSVMLQGEIDRESFDSLGQASVSQKKGYSGLFGVAKEIYEQGWKNCNPIARAGDPGEMAREIMPEIAKALCSSVEVSESSFDTALSRFDAFVSMNAHWVATAIKRSRTPARNDATDQLMLLQVGLGCFVTSDQSFVKKVRETDTCQIPWVRTVKEYDGILGTLPRCRPWGAAAARAAQEFRERCMV